jgi:outer membrane protein OmpA-like peptidoglycan-associated protein
MEMRFPLKLTLAALLASVSISPALAADSCSGLAGQIGEARKAKDLPRLLSLLGRAQAPEAGCATTAMFCLGRQAALAHVETFYAQVDAKAPFATLEKTLADGERNGAPWPQLVALADIRFEEGRKSKDPALLNAAARDYQRALTVLRDEEDRVCPGEPAPTPAAIAAIHRSMTEAVLLAPRVEQVTTRDGRCGGAFLAVIRGFVTEKRPVPIRFNYNEASLTPEGDTAARTLADCLKREQYGLVELSGHTDQRGTEAYNLDLSARRLATVRSFLVKEGFGGKVVTTPKGKSEPFRADDRGKYSQDELDQFDRRVELRRSDAK